MPSSLVANSSTSPAFTVIFYLILMILLITEITLLQDKTPTNGHKAWLWVVIIAVKSPNFIILLTTAQLDILFFHVISTTVSCLLIIILTDLIIYNH